VRWEPIDRALEVLSYDNTRGVLKRAAEMARTLVAAGRGRPLRAPTPIVPPPVPVSAPPAD
jgi:hypothetical protein